MDGGTAAVIGAAIGALGGMSGGLISSLGQRRQVRAEHSRWRDDTRLQAYTDFIAAGKQLSAAQWRLADSLWDTTSSPSEWQDRFVVVHDAWAVFSTAAAAVAVAGPKSAAESADTFRTAMLNVERAVMTWLNKARDTGHGRLDECDQAFQSAMSAKRQPDREFQATARAALETEA
ncbi:hypothetical protein [Streptomyces gardneri]|uniref:hypothetical protein n=1 Tax=Streptomyces gardneri TaxID=66892 RepID=UPI0035E10F85